MASKIKILSINYGINLQCIRIIPKTGEKENNPFRLYLLYTGRDKYGYPAKKRIQIAKYGNFDSVIYHIKDMFSAGLAGLSIDYIIAWNKDYSSRKA